MPNYQNFSFSYVNVQILIFNGKHFVGELVKNVKNSNVPC